MRPATAVFALLACVAATASAFTAAALPTAADRVWVALPSEVSASASSSRAAKVGHASANANAAAAAVSFNSDSASASARRFDVRYSFAGLDVAVLSKEQLQRLSAADRRRVTVLGDFDENDTRTLVVLEPNPDAAIAASSSFADPIRAAASDAVAHGAELLYQESGRAVVRLPMAAVNQGYIFPNENLVQDVPVSLVSVEDPPVFEGSPASRVVPDTGVVFDPVVQALISEVDKRRIKQTDVHLSEAFFTRLSTSPDARLAEKWLFDQYSSIPRLQVTTFPWNPNHAANVIASLKGAIDPDKYIVVGAHFDSRSANITDPNVRAPGADDNASGSSAILEFARILAETPVRFAYSILFCAFSGEEQGLLGSRAFAAQLKEEGAQIVAMFNADMLGYHAPADPIALGMKNRFITPWLLAKSIEITNTYSDIPVGESNSCCSDYQSFFEQNYPSIGFFESLNAAANNPNYHQSSDTSSTVDFDQITREAAAMLATVTTFAGPVESVVVRERNGTLHWRYGDQAIIHLPL